LIKTAIAAVFAVEFSTEHQAIDAAALTTDAFRPLAVSLTKYQWPAAKLDVEIFPVVAMTGKVVSFHAGCALTHVGAGIVSKTPLESQPTR
jgi:hypothetical protein